MKRSIIYLSAICFLFIGTTALKAQDFNPKKNNYLILSKNIRQIEPVLLTAHELAAEDNEYGDFYVIICGKTVKDMPNNEDLKRLLKKAKAQHVSIFVCGISLSKFNVSLEDLPENLTIIENGILYGLQLSKKGFITLTI